MRIYNQLGSPTSPKKPSDEESSKDNQPKKSSALQEKMLKYQAVAAHEDENNESATIQPPLCKRPADMPEADINLKDRMAAWGYKDEPETPIEEEEKVVDGSDDEEGDEALSLADRMAKLREQADPNKFAQTKAQKEMEEAKRLQEEIELKKKLEEEARLKADRKAKGLACNRKASSAIQERMKAWGTGVGEEVPEVAEEEVTSAGEADKGVENDKDNTPAEDEEEEVTKSSKQRPFVRPADMPETPKLRDFMNAYKEGSTREFAKPSTPSDLPVGMGKSQKERVAQWGSGTPVKEEAVATVEEKEGEKVDLAHPLAGVEAAKEDVQVKSQTRPADMPETPNLLKERMAQWGGGGGAATVDEAPAVVDEKVKDEEETTKDNKGEVLPEDKPRVSYTKETTEDDNGEGQKPRRSSALLEQKMNAYMRQSSKELEPTTSPKPKKPVDMPEVSHLTDKLSAYKMVGSGENTEPSSYKKPIDMPEVPKLKDFMNAYKEGSTREFTKATGGRPSDLPAGGKSLKDMMNAYKEGSTREFKVEKPSAPADLPTEYSAKAKTMTKVWEQGAEEKEEGKEKDNDSDLAVCSNVLKEKMAAWEKSGAAETGDDEVDADTAALLDSALKLSSEERKEELLDIVNDRTISPEARVARIYEKISLMKADDIVINKDKSIEQ